MSNLATALSDVIDEHIDFREGKHPKTGAGYIWRGSVISMSLSFAAIYSKAMEEQFERAASEGIPIAVNAQNKRDDASKWMPCAFSTRETMRVTCVGGLDNDYWNAHFSAYGNNVQYAAPAVDVDGPDLLDHGKTKILSGNSYATPQLAGVMAIKVGYEALNRNERDCSDVQIMLEENASPVPLKGWPDSLEPQLLHTGIRHPDAVNRMLPVHTCLRIRGISRTLTTLSVCTRSKMASPHTKRHLRLGARGRGRGRSRSACLSCPC